MKYEAMREHTEPYSAAALASTCTGDGRCFSRKEGKKGRVLEYRLVLISTVHTFLSPCS